MKNENNIKYFETHAHYTSYQFNEDREDLLNVLQSSGVQYAVNIGSNIGDSYGGVEIAEKYPFVYATVGFHPHDVSNMRDYHLEELEELASHKKVVGIGEIGLDY